MSEGNDSGLRRMMACYRIQATLPHIFLLGLVFFVSGSNSVYRGNYVGCLFSSDVCSDYELCVDDGLFGECKSKPYIPEKRPIRLTGEQVTELEENMQHLIDNGYSWHHEYAQCLVKHYVNEYTKGRTKVSYPVECSRQESQRKLENFDRKLGRERLKQTFESVLKAGRAGQKLQHRDDYHSEDRRKKKENKELEAYLRQLSAEELENVQLFLLDEAFMSPDNDSVVKKSPLSTMTSVLVRYHPAEDVAPNNDYQGLQEESDDLSSSRDRNPLPFENIIRPKFVAAETPSPSQQDEPVRTLPTTAANVYRPPYKHLKVQAGSHPPILNNFRVGGPIFSKDLSVKAEPVEQSRMSRNHQKYLITMYVLCGFVAVATLLAVVLYFVRRRSRFREKISRWANKSRQDSTGDYQDLCRHHMQSRLSEKLIESPTSLMSRQSKTVLPDAGSPTSVTRKDHPNTRTSSTNSSTSSWAEEPVNSNMDISTGHLILSYMEDHMKNKDRLQREWDDICSNDGEPCSIVAGIEPTNMRKNRCTDILPYEHSRIKLNPSNNISGSDYINANYITDHDPRNPAYIATQGPLPHTVADFWQMIWEQNSVVIVNLTKLWENSTSICHRYWPEEGTDLYHIYEVQLISEHNLCDDFVVRSLFLKNLQVSETRTITQFHFLTWPDHAVPASTKVLLDFRRKVNKSYRGRSSPMVVHCSDGAGRTGTYSLIDMSLNRLSKGAKEIDIAATLEHLRDQRVNMVRTKDQFEFALAAVAEEVHAVLNFAQP